MVSGTSKRLMKEFADLTTNPPDGVIVTSDNPGLTWSVLLSGPSETPYEGGTFMFKLEFPYNYPFKPPKAKFITKIYHPSIKQDSGEICQDIYDAESIVKYDIFGICVRLYIAITLLEEDWVPTKTIRKGLIDVLKTVLFSSSVFVNSRLTSTSPTLLLAWCSSDNNKISVFDLETKQNYVTFDGASFSDTSYGTHVKEIPNTKLLVSLHHSYSKSANMEIFDISKKGKANKIYSLGEIYGSKPGVGEGDVTYNSRRRILGAIPITGRIAYHLFTIDTSASNAGGIIKLNRKSKWHSQYGTQEDNFINGFDFNPAGDSIATIDRYGVCLISDVNTNDYRFHLQVGSKSDRFGRCRWSTNTGEPLLFVKYNLRQLNILDVEKKALILSNPVELEIRDWTFSPYTRWIDVCQSNGNLLVSDGDNDVKIFDKRESKIVKTFERIHLKWINCVRWNPSGEMIASASQDNLTKLLDIKTGRVLHTDTIKSWTSKTSLTNIN